MTMVALKGEAADRRLRGCEQPNLLTMSTPMQSPSWMTAAAGAFASAPDLVRIVAGSPDAPRAQALLARRTHPTHLEPVGATELYEPVDWPCRDAESLRELSEACASLSVPVFIPRVVASSPLIEAMRQAYRGRGLVLTHPVDGCLWVALDPSWAEPERHLSSDHRRNLMRRRRRAEEIGEVRYEVLAPRIDELNALLEEVLRIEATGWKGACGSALRFDATRYAFFRTYAELAAEEGVLRVCFLRFGDEIAAAQIGVEQHGAFWALKMGYDERFARLSPGRLLALEAFRDAALRGLERFEMLGAAEPWKLEWNPRCHPCVAVRAYPCTIPAAVTLATDVAAWSWRRLVRHWGSMGMGATTAHCAADRSANAR